jgi:hypothetical protein
MRTSCGRCSTWNTLTVDTEALSPKVAELGKPTRREESRRINEESSSPIVSPRGVRRAMFHVKHSRRKHSAFGLPKVAELAQPTQCENRSESMKNRLPLS